MKKWKNSAAAKFVAWIILTICAVGCVASAAVIMAMTGEGIYTETEEQVKERMIGEVSSRYAILALKNYLSGYKNANEKAFEGKSYRYGIIEAQNLEGIDLNKAENYLERNFTKKISANDIRSSEIDISDSTELHYEDGFLFGSAWVTHMSDNWKSLYVDTIGYDKKTGILYYGVEDQYYPVQQVALQWDGSEYYYYYNAEKQVYEQEPSVSEATTAYEEGGENVTSDGYMIADTATSATTETYYLEPQGRQLQGELDDSTIEHVSQILSQNEFTFVMLDNIGLDRKMLGKLVLSGIREIDADKVTDIDTGNGAKVVSAGTDDYYLDANYTLHVNTGEKGKNYIVVSVLPDGIGYSWNSADMYVQANTLVTLAYRWRYLVFVIFAVTLALGIGTFVFLLCAAGHRKGTDEIVAMPVDKMWFDVETGLFFGVELLLLCIMSEIGYQLPETPFLQVFLFLGLVMGWFFLWYLLSAAVRIKRGKWWRNTLIYKVLAPVNRFLRMTWENITFLWRIIIVLAVLMVFEFFGILILQYNFQILLFVWLIERTVITVVIICTAVQMKQLKDGGERIAKGDLAHKIDTSQMMFDFKRHGEAINGISEGMSKAVDERMKSERFKTELITNVSHDIKTPLTSIINYVDLLEKEKLDNPTAEEYLEVLERQSARLKKLIEDLMEASKASTGNLPVHLERLEAGVFMVQTVGEFEERTKAAELDLQIKKPEEPVYIMADGRHFWRVIDNLMNNICKYAQPGTRVYINMENRDGKVEITFRNTSKYALNISSDELMERFVRGDSSRNTEGSGLGLSIANSLMELMGGTCNLYVDGDLFKVVLEFKQA